MKLVHVSYRDLVAYKASRDSRFVLWTWGRMMDKTAEVWRRV